MGLSHLFLTMRVLQIKDFQAQHIQQIRPRILREQPPSACWLFPFDSSKVVRVSALVIVMKYTPALLCRLQTEKKDAMNNAVIKVYWPRNVRSEQKCDDQISLRFKQSI